MAGETLAKIENAWASDLLIGPYTCILLWNYESGWAS